MCHEGINDISENMFRNCNTKYVLSIIYAFYNHNNRIYKLKYKYVNTSYSYFNKEYFDISRKYFVEYFLIFPLI